MEVFSTRYVGPVSGLGGMFGGVAGILTQLLIGWMAERSSYAPIFLMFSLFPLLGLVAVHLLAGELGIIRECRPVGPRQPAVPGEFHPLSQGFTSFYGHYNSYIDYFSLMREGERDWHRDWSPSRDQGYATDLEADEAVRFVKANGPAQPFFLYLALTAPHTPLQATAADLEPYREWPEPRRTYAAMVTHMDRAIGRLLGALDDEGLTGNTLLLFLSDNGGDRAGGGDNTPLRTFIT